MKQVTQFMTNLRSAMISTLGVAILLCAFVVSASAQTPQVPSANEVFVGGTLFITIRTPWGDLTADQRASEVQDRINHALSIGPIHPSDITVGPLDGDWVVFLRGQRLYTADELTGKAESTSTKVLAQEWAAHLRQQLPPLTAPTNGIPSTVPTTPAAPAAPTAPTTPAAAP